MEISDRIHNYLSLLEIRQKTRQRNVTIIGGVFILSILFTLALGLIGELSGRSVYLIVGIDIAFGVAFLQAWVKLEIVQSSIDLLNNLQP